jgi:ArsR family transcriptional regulator
MVNNIAIDEVLRALGHPARVRIVRMLMEGERCVGDLQHDLELPQSTVSQHLARLKAAGVVRGRSRGTQRCYRVVDERVRDILAMVQRE